MGFGESEAGLAAKPPRGRRSSSKPHSVEWRCRRPRRHANLSPPCRARHPQPREAGASCEQLCFERYV